MKSFNGRVAVVTGAAKGIGRALAFRLAQEGAHLALSDIDDDGLAATAREASEVAEAAGRAIDIHQAILDVADRAAFTAYVTEVTGHFEQVHLVFNNAGVALGAHIREMSFEDIEWLMGINYWGVVYGTMLFLPHLERADEAHIVNISSVFGLVGVPSQAAYNSAKFAVRGFTEALRMELAVDDSTVSCTCVHPAGVATDIALASRVGSLRTDAPSRQEADEYFRKIARRTPESAARIILRGVKRKKRRIRVGFDAVLLDWFQRLLPTGYQRIIEFSVRRNPIPM